MNEHLINRLAGEWANLDPVDPLRQLIADAIAELNARPAVPERKPLTDEEIQKLLSQHRFAVFALVRSVEAAHGITSPKDEGESK